MVVSRWVEGADVDGVIARVLRAVGRIGLALYFVGAEALELLEPVEDHLELRRRTVGYHQKALAVGRDIIVGTESVAAPVEGLLVELGGS